MFLKNRNIISKIEKSKALNYKNCCNFYGKVFSVNHFSKMIEINYVLTYMKIDYITAVSKVIKGAKIRNQYNQVPHLTQETNGKVKKTYS